MAEQGTCAVAGRELPDSGGPGSSEPDTSPSAKTLGWSFTRSIGSVLTAPLSVAGKGSLGVLSLTPSLDTGLLPAVHSTRSACSTCWTLALFKTGSKIENAGGKQDCQSASCRIVSTRRRAFLAMSSCIHELKLLSLGVCGH